MVIDMAVKIKKPVKPKKSKALTGAKARELRVLTRAFVVLGYNDDEISNELGISVSHAVRLRKRINSDELEALRSKNNDEVFLDYVRNMERCILDLDDVLKDPLNKNPNAKVSAIRAKMDAYDRVISTGQNLGFIKREPKRLEIAGGIVVSELPADELRIQIVRELQGLRDMVKKHGDKDILDVEFEEVKSREVAALASGDTPSGALGRDKEARIARSKYRRNGKKK